MKTNAGLFRYDCRSVCSKRFLNVSFNKIIANNVKYGLNTEHAEFTALLKPIIIIIIKDLATRFEGQRLKVASSGN